MAAGFCLFAQVFVLALAQAFVVLAVVAVVCHPIVLLAIILVSLSRNGISFTAFKI